jgi:hypothetical protein
MAIQLHGCTAVRVQLYRPHKWILKLDRALSPAGKLESCLWSPELQNRVANSSNC